MLISKTHGNWLFLATILTRVEIAPDQPLRKTAVQPEEGERAGLLCGKCTRCLDACPTDAFSAPGVVDARRCISYQTIENKGIIPQELREGIGMRIYGCDVCLEVCPWNRFAQRGRQTLLAARHDMADLPLKEILELTPERFAELFRKTAIKRLKITGLLRNACVVAGNLGDAALLPAIAKLASHDSPVVRAHAVWAVRKIAGAENSRSLLEGARKNEADPAVLSEYPSD
jgi:epoxyqueuosine reductase